MTKMLRYILNNLAGYLRIRVEGYSPERFLNLCCYHGIFLWNLRPAKGAYEMNIRVRDLQTATNGQEEQGKGKDHPEKRSPVFYT